jgi:hypothetical protein
MDNFKPVLLRLPYKTSFIFVNVSKLKYLKCAKKRSKNGELSNMLISRLSAMSLKKNILLDFTLKKITPSSAQIENFLIVVKRRTYKSIIISTNLNYLIKRPAFLSCRSKEIN